MARSKGKPAQARYDPEFRVKVVRTSLEKNLTAEEARDLYGVCESTWWTWKRVYRRDGEDGLRKHGRSRGRPQKTLPIAMEAKVREHALATKREYPFFGVFRVWQWLLRTIFLPVSFRQVRHTLAEADLIGKTVKKKRKPRKPRRFERAKPNEMWATDITEFQLAGGQTVYVIAFLDDHSRYIVSWGIYAGCAGELVLEVLRKGIAVYGRPAEMLSDHGPQFWVRRGKTQFQKFLQREDITHILASTPESNGKIEAYWGTMKKEFVERTKRKGDLEEVRDRLAHWINFYNFQRYHTEIGGTPAERYFQYQAALKEEIQKRIRKNEEELALAKTPPSSVIGHTTLGSENVEIKKEGDEFIVRLGDQVLTRTTIGKEKHDATESGALGETGGGGPGREGESVDRPTGAVGGKDGGPDLPRDGSEAAHVLQTGGKDAAGNAGRGENAEPPEEPQGSDGAGGVAGAGDGGAPQGASADGEPHARLEEAPPSEKPETAEKRLPEAKSGETAEGSRDLGASRAADIPEYRGLKELGEEKP